jgi:hypothetical protein
MAAKIDEQVTVTVKRRISVELVDGGLYFVAYTNPEGKEARKAATTISSLYQTIGEVLGVEKKPRKPRQKKAAE